jgi:hypothetical protein
MEKKLFMLFICLLISNQFMGQDDTNNYNNNHKYYRSSLTTLLLGFPENNKYKNFVEREFHLTGVPDKFFENIIEPRIIEIDSLKREIGSIRDLENLQKDIIEELVVKRYTNKVVDHWFSKSEEGKFDLARFCERGLYSATDQEYLLAQQHIRGTRVLFDLASELINRNYIFVVAFSNILTMDEYYLTTNTLNSDRVARGFI